MLIDLILLIIEEFVVAILPTYFAALLVTGKKSIGKAILASIIGPVVFTLSLLFFGGIILFSIPFAIPIAFFISLLIVFYFYAALFNTNLAGGALISIVSLLISILILMVSGFVFLFSGMPPFPVHHP